MLPALTQHQLNVHGMAVVQEEKGMRRKLQGSEHVVITSYETKHLLSSFQMCLISQPPS